MKISYLYILLTPIFLIGCSKKSTENKENTISSKYILREVEDKQFELDENTTQNSPYFQYISNKDSSIFAFINEYDNSITINNFKTCKLIKKIYFNKEGPNGVGKIQNFYIKDSLIYIHNHGEQTIYITDFYATIRDKISIDLSSYIADGINVPAILPDPIRPLNSIKDELILCGFTIEREGETKENTPSTVLYNLKNKTIRFTNGFPELYHKGNWGINPTYRFISYTINNKNEMVISYPADGYIYINNLSNEIRKYYAGIENGEDGLKPITKKRNTRISFEEEDRHYMNNIVYGGIFYDKNENIYYRIVTLPTKMDKKKKSNMYNKRIQIIVLDNKFNIIGRYNIKENIYISGYSFLSNEGLHIKTNSSDDDFMKFKTFKLCKK